jgi:hypothetical protein
MSALDVVLRLRAVSSGNAQPRTSVRHRHLDHDPLVVVAYRLAGESAAPLGLMYGSREADPMLLVAPEPRNRQIRFQEVFNPFAVDLNRYIAGRGATKEPERGRPTCQRAPQVLVPNSATAEFVGPLFGRSLRYLSTEGEYAVPEDTVVAGAHLTWLGLQAELPGSSVMLAATELLRRHWVAGLSDLESEDLHVQLAWIDPPDGSTGSTAAAAVEDNRFAGVLPAAGPTPDPTWDRDVLDPLVTDFNEQRERSDEHGVVTRLGTDIRAAVEAALRPTWEATWRCRDLVLALPEAESVSARWASDRREFTRHIDRVEAGEARFRVRDNVKQTAFMVGQREAAQSALESNEALDDPLVLAAAIGDGLAIAGTVTRVDKPIVEIELSGPCPVPLGTELFWTAMRGGNCSVVVTATASDVPFTVELTTRKGKTKYYPVVGDRAAYAPFKDAYMPSPSMPIDVPWTHQGPEAPLPVPEVPE